MLPSLNAREKLFTFSLNGEDWTVCYTNLIDDDRYIYGQTLYEPHLILLKCDLPEVTRRRTLVHEFTHVWLYATGHDESKLRTFEEEEVCCLYSQMYDMLSNILELYDCARLAKLKEE